MSSQPIKNVTTKKPLPPKAEASVEVPTTSTISEQATVLLNTLKDLELQVQALDHTWQMNGSPSGMIMGNGENGVVTYEMERARLMQGRERLAEANPELMPVVHALVKAAADQDAAQREALLS